MKIEPTQYHTNGILFLINYDIMIIIQDTKMHENLMINHYCTVFLSYALSDM